ncbi:hypothetical protein EXM65_14590 [Clostridium botulinum]|uniref:Uncharacterized protein n=1 Tax=Clostridium botulinum TaxID=1491 RepID=A0A6M0STS3_CLOBO|nr:hypothetical protein [Clostridium botulinum]
MNKISETVGKIVSCLVEGKKAVLITLSNHNKDTTELTINENGVRIYIYQHGIRITANTNSNNLNLGLGKTNYKTRCYKVFGLNDYKKVAHTILNLQ